MQKSFFVPDFRPQEQKDTLYVSCRVMKAISYGCPVVCDAPYVKDFIDKEVLCAETAQEIFDLGVDISMIRRECVTSLKLSSEIILI